jgi:3-hydroxyisobutyrate dehydrogenase-like beta-hydroxyacid dehydrogenase
MSDISALGLGRMGSALARALINGGHNVTVWNRSPAKALPLVELGATLAGSVATAVESSPVILICVDNYQVTRTMFESPDAVRKLSGRIVVQLSTGTPKEARESEAWFVAHGAQYLDGAILAGPNAIGTPNSTILYSGWRDAFERCNDLLKSFGDDVRFVGDKIGSAAALDLAWLSKLFGTYAGVAHGAILCESEGVDLDLYSKVFMEKDSARWMIDVIGMNAFKNPGATLGVWNAALQRIRDQASDKEINCEVPDFVAGILSRAIAAGHGDEHVAAMVKVFRSPSNLVTRWEA